MKFTPVQNLTPELIVWEDITSYEDGWSTKDAITEWFNDEGDGVCETVGYVIAENKDVILISDTFIETLGYYGTVTKIPKAVIRKRTKLIEGT
jgi:hypothetical protein